MISGVYIHLYNILPQLLSQCRTNTSASLATRWFAFKLVAGSGSAFVNLSDFWVMPTYAMLLSKSSRNICPSLECMQCALVSKMSGLTSTPPHWYALPGVVPWQWQANARVGWYIGGRVVVEVSGFSITNKRINNESLENETRLAPIILHKYDKLSYYSCHGRIIRMPVNACG